METRTYWEHAGVIIRLFGVYNEDILGTYKDILGTYWGHTGTYWGHNASILLTKRGHPGVIMGIHWGEIEDFVCIEVPVFDWLNKFHETYE